MNQTNIFYKPWSISHPASARSPPACNTEYSKQKDSFHSMSTCSLLSFQWWSPMCLL